MTETIEAAGQEAPPGALDALKMSIYFVTYDPETGAAADEGADKKAVAPFSSLRVQVYLTAEETGLIRKALRSCRAVFVETQQTDGETDRIMMAVGTVTSG